MSSEETLDPNQFLPLFLEEANEQVASLEDGAAHLSQGATAGEPLLQEMYRSAHTLKGSARMMGFATVGELAAKLEELLGAWKDGGLTPSGAIAETIATSVRALAGMVADIAAGGRGDANISGVVEEIIRHLGVSADDGGKSATAAAGLPTLLAKEIDPSALARDLTEPEQAVIRSALAGGKQAILVTVRLADDCAIKAGRVAVVVSVLTALGGVVRFFPSRSELESEQFEDTFAALLVTSQPTAVEGAVLRVPEVRDVTVQAWTASSDTAPLTRRAVG